MAMDPKAAQALRKLFTTKAGQYPYLLPAAEILLENGAGTRMRFQAHTPAEAANILAHIANNDGTSIFARELETKSLTPVTLVMNKRARLGPHHMEHLIEAFRMTFQSFAESGHLKINDPDVNEYFWQGEERIDKAPPMTFHAPNLAEVIAILQRAGTEWRNVNFMISPGQKRHLRAVQSGTKSPHP